MSKEISKMVFFILYYYKRNFNVNCKAQVIKLSYSYVIRNQLWERIAHISNSVKLETSFVAVLINISHLTGRRLAESSPLKFDSLREGARTQLILDNTN